MGFAMADQMKPSAVRGCNGAGLVQAARGPAWPSPLSCFDSVRVCAGAQIIPENPGPDCELALFICYALSLISSTKGPWGGAVHAGAPGGHRFILRKIKRRKN